MKRSKVLFLCTGNSARSQMAEALARHLAGGQLEVFSAGTHPAGRVHPAAVKVMEELGIDISAARPKKVEDLPVAEFDWVITVCDQASQECPLWLARGKKLHWSIPDPAAADGTEEQVLEAFRAARNDLKARLEAWLAEEGP
ncbi:MAG: arsenate reductase ArsC [Armatimonadetes bacterium]|nr:arsenate reductase ArsC [Armatimonadota bacterium]